MCFFCVHIIPSFGSAFIVVRGWKFDMLLFGGSKTRNFEWETTGRFHIFLHAHFYAKTTFAKTWKAIDVSHSKQHVILRTSSSGCKMRRFRSAKQMVLGAIDFWVIFTSSFGSVFIVGFAPKIWFFGSARDKNCNFEWKTTIRFACFRGGCFSTKISPSKTCKSTRCFSFKMCKTTAFCQFFNTVHAKMMQTDRRYQ